MKTASRKWIVRVLVALAVAAIAMPFVGPLYVRWRFEPPSANATLKQVEASIGVPLAQRTVVAPGGQRYVVGTAPITTWAVPSGPPAYVFGPTGSLVDYTPDCGDDPRFASKWMR